MGRYYYLYFAEEKVKTQRGYNQKTGERYINTKQKKAEEPILISSNVQFRTKEN